MGMFRTFETDSGLIAITATGLSAPLLYIAPAAAASANGFKFKVSCEAGTGTPTVPTSSSLFFSLNTVTGTKAGGAALTPTPTGPDTTAAQTVFSTGTTAITGLTQAAERWGQPIPFSPGSFAGDDDPNTGEEAWFAPSGQYAFYVTVPAGPGAGSNLYARVITWHAE